MTVARPAAVTVAFLLVLLQILIAMIATVTAALAPADYKTYAVTTPVFLVVLYGGWRSTCGSGGRGPAW